MGEAFQTTVWLWLNKTFPLWSKLLANYKSRLKLCPVQTSWSEGDCEGASANNVPLFLLLQPGRAQESQTGPKGPLGRSLPDAGLEQWPEFREDQLQPLEPPLPQAAAQPHALRIQGPKALQYPSSSRCCTSWFLVELEQHLVQGWANFDRWATMGSKNPQYSENGSGLMECLSDPPHWRKKKAIIVFMKVLCVENTLYCQLNMNKIPVFEAQQHWVLYWDDDWTSRKKIYLCTLCYLCQFQQSLTRHMWPPGHSLPLPDIVSA